MRSVRVTKEDIDLGMNLVDGGTAFVGTDRVTGELVSFKLEDGDLANALIGRAAGEGVFTITVADFQVLAVQPVRGEWDSPGTSPEED
jgi:hypothetical protein